MEYIDSTQIIIKRNILTFGPGANGKAASEDQQKKGEDKTYKCECSEIVPTNNHEKMNAHKKRCTKMSQKHKNLMDVFDKLIEEATIKELDFMDHEVLENVEQLRNHFDRVVKQKSVDKIASLSIDSDIEEEKVPL